MRAGVISVLIMVMSGVELEGTTLQLLGLSIGDLRCPRRMVCLKFTPAFNTFRVMLNTYCSFTLKEGRRLVSKKKHV